MAYVFTDARGQIAERSMDRGVLRSPTHQRFEGKPGDVDERMQGGAGCLQDFFHRCSSHSLVPFTNCTHNLLAGDRGLDVAHVERGLVLILF